MSVMLRTLARGQFGSDTSHIFQMWWAPGTLGGSTADATDILARYRAMWAALGAKICTGYSITFDPICIAVESTNEQLVGAFAGTQPANVSGAGGSSPLPLQTQGLIRWGTAGVAGGRRVRGRTFVPCPDEGDNDSAAAPSTSYKSQLAAGVTALLTAGTTGSAPGVWHKATEATEDRPATVGAIYAITSGAASSSWSVMRTRR
jgi:hypothetical protein